MFETAQLGQRVSKKEYAERRPELCAQLLEAQADLQKAEFPVILLLAGVDKAGKSETATLLSEWMDPRGIITRAFDEPTQEEAERPEFWRYWRDLPPKGAIGTFLSAWYHDPLLDRVFGRLEDGEFERRLERIVSFERTLADDGALILKFWMHLDRQAQRKRLRALEKDPLESWRVTKRDWKHWKLYDRFVETAERIITRTSVGAASWRIIEGADARYRNLRVGSILLDRLSQRLAESSASARVREAGEARGGADERAPVVQPVTVLSRLDMDRELPRGDYRPRLRAQQGRLHLLQREAMARRISTILVFEGWDAAGKGGAIRRLLAGLDARSYRVHPVAAPTDEERAQHYLWRFWRLIPRAGRITVFDRSWYGRVLVERVEQFARHSEWRRAYGEINDFEEQLVQGGSVLVKFWIHITKQEQRARFEARRTTPHKRWKLSDEDLRNRGKWDQYELAVHDMVERTSTRLAPWHLVEGNDKRYARVNVLSTVCDALERALAAAEGS